MSSSNKVVQLHREALQRQTQQDWVNREYVELISGSIKRITDFLNAFNMSCSGKLADLNSKLSMLERKVAFLEAKVEIYDRKKVGPMQQPVVLNSQPELARYVDEEDFDDDDEEEEFENGH